MLGTGFFEFNLGHAITIAMGIIAWAVSWGKWKSDMESLKATVAAQTERIEEIDRTGGIVTERDRNNIHEMVRDHEDRIRKLESLSSKIEQISADTSWMKSHILKAIRASHQLE